MIAWLSGLAVCAAVVVVAIAGMLLVRRSVTLSILESHNDVAGFIYAVLGVLYAVLLGFVVVVVWERYEAAETRAEQEANELGDLFRDAEAFPDSVRRRLRARIRDYARVVVHEEWRAMAGGRPSPAAWESFSRLWEGYLLARPLTAYEEAWYRTSLEQLNRLGDQRRLRLLSSRLSIPGVLWVVLLAGGLLTISFSYLFGTRNVWSQGLMTAALSSTVALILFLISALEHPFAGVARLEPVAFQQLTEIFERWEGGR